MTRTFEPLRSLERPDKHFLGTGEGVLYAPPFPLFQDSAGFWDVFHYHLHAFSPGFTWTLLDERGLPLRLERKRREWTPARIRTTFQTGGGIAVTEKRAVSGWDSLLARVSVRNLSRKPVELRLLLWTAVGADGLRPGSPPAEKDGRIAQWIVSRTPYDAELGWALGASPGPGSFGVQLAEGQPAGAAANLPAWEMTPFSERLRRSASLGNTVRATGVSPEGLLYIGIERRLVLEPGDARACHLALALGPDPGAAAENLHRTLEPEDPMEEAEARWRRFFDEVPRLECSDEHVLAAYWYRWYGLRLNAFSRPFGAYRHPAVCEGIEYFRSPISYSAQCHMREMRWHPDGGHAKGSLLNFIEHQLEDGSFPGHIHPRGPVPRTFYHADWGAAALDVAAVHEDRAFLERAFEGLSRYAEHFIRDRDEGGTGLFDVWSQYETGQEYMSRYVAARAEEAGRVADWERTIRLKGVDATVYAYRLFEALARIEPYLGRGSGERWRSLAARTAEAIRTRMWDPATGLFQDVRADTLERTGVLAATGFYPHLAGIAGEPHVKGLLANLGDPTRFGTPFPVPATAVSDPLFDAEGLWQGKRHNCPWNGRVWPMAVSHVAEAVLTAATRHPDPALDDAARKLFGSFIRLLFLEGDPRRPACYEHYNPYTGQPCLHRGIDDYMHSTVIDLVIQYAAGVRPTLEGLVFDPRPLGIASLRLENVQVRGRRYDVEVEGGRAVLRSEDRTVAERRMGDGPRLEPITAPATE